MFVFLSSPDSRQSIFDHLPMFNPRQIDRRSVYELDRLIQLHLVQWHFQFGDTLSAYPAHRHFLYPLHEFDQAYCPNIKAKGRGSTNLEFYTKEGCGITLGVSPDLITKPGRREKLVFKVVVVYNKFWILVLHRSIFINRNIDDIVYAILTCILFLRVS